MRIVRGLWLIVLMLSAYGGSAQYFQFSQYNYADQRVSPTAPAQSDYARLSFLYRNQGTGGDINLNSNILSASYPLLTRKTGKRWSGVGVTLMDDRSGGLYKMSEASVSYAVNVFLSDLQTLSLGFKGLYQQRRIDLSGLYTGLQYIPDRGFDESLSSGESFGTFRSNYVTFSSGLSWQQLNKGGVRVAYWSFSLFDLNKPDESFLGDGEHSLNSTLVGAGGFRAYKNNNMSVFPEVLYTRGSANNVLNVGFITRCDVKGSRNQKPFYVDVITKYVVGRSGIFGMQFHNENFSLGLSYDLLVNKNNPANFGAFEIGLELRSLVVRDPRNRNTKKNPQVNQKTQPVKPVAKTPVKKPVTEKTKSDSLDSPVHPHQDLSKKLEMKKDSVLANAKAGELKHEPFVLEKVVLHFNFEFNSTDLDDESKVYLDDLTKALNENIHLRVKLTGHTDNIGSAKFNQRLSLFRANSIKEYIVSKGIDPGRIDTEGRGLTEPLNDNKTEEGRAKNRRVELTIFYEE